MSLAFKISFLKNKMCKLRLVTISPILVYILSPVHSSYLIVLTWFINDVPGRNDLLMTLY